MNAAGLAQALKAKRNGSGWMARCPAHDDQRASLSIGEGEDGRLLLHCHAGCAFDAILKAAGVEPTKTNGEERGKPRIVATYDYHDAAGTLAYQVVRYHPKDFRQRRPDGHGDWIWNMKGIERVPYRLPQLLNASEIYICEGEKDCDRLADLGLVATTNPGGADKDGEGGKKWPDSFGRWFHGRHAILIPDNDESGRRHVRAVARKLKDHAASIKILELPNLPPKGDVSDWLASGGTAEQLEELTAAAPYWEPSDEANTKAAPIFLSAAEFVAGYRPLRPLIKAWDMKPGWLYSLTAPTGYAKTAISLDEAMRLALAGKRIIYLAGENPDEVRARVLLMQSKLQLAELPATLRFVAHAFDIKASIDHVRNQVKAMGGSDLIIVDTSPAFQVMAGSAEENSNTEQLGWALMLRQLTQLEGCPAVLALCHPVKRPQSVEDLLPRGGGSFLAEVDGNYTSWLTAEDGDRKFFDFSWTAKFRGSFEPLHYVVEITTCEALIDPDGNPIKSAWAFRADDHQVERAAADQTEDDDAVLMAMDDYPGKSLSEWARLLNWHIPSGPAKYRVERAVKRLRKHKLAQLGRDNHYRLTTAGKQEAKRVSDRVRSGAK